MAEKRTIEIRLKSKSAESSADRLNTKVKGIGTSADTSEKSMGLLSKAAIAVGAALATRQVVQYADAWTNVNNRLRAATSTHAEFLTAQKGVIAIAQEAGVSITGVADSYSRLAQATSELGVSQERVLKVTRNVALALKAGGATAQEVSSIAVQLGQGLGAGALQGDELRSILESSIPIAKALAKEFNVTTGELKKLGAEGKLTSIRVISALENIDEKSLKFTKGISGGFTELSNALTVYVGGVDESLGVTNTLVGSMSALAENIDLVVEGAAALVVLLGARYAGALSLARAATVAKATANAQLVASEIAALNASRAVAQQDVIRAVQAQTLGKLQLKAAHNTLARGQAITALAIANGRLITTEVALTSATTAYTAAAARATVASRTLSTAMAFIGGPVGLAIIAAAALFIFVDGADSAKESAEKAADEVNFLADSFKNLSDNQRATALNKTEAEMKALSDELVIASNKLNQFKKFSDSPIKIQGIRQAEAEIFSLNQQMDAVARKQEALVGAPDLSGGIKRNFVDGAEVEKDDKDVKVSAFTLRLEQETESLRLNLALRKAVQDEFLSQEAADEIERVTMKLNNSQMQFDAELVKLGDDEIAKEELRSQFRELQLLNVQEFQANLTDIESSEAANRSKNEISANDRVLRSKQQTQNAAIGLLAVFAGKSKAAALVLLGIQKALAIGEVIVNSQVAATRALAELGPIIGAPVAASMITYGQVSAGIIAATGLAQGAGIASGGSSVSTSAPIGGGASINTGQQPLPPSQQNQQRTINFVGLEGIGDDELIPLTIGGLKSLFEANEDVSISINAGQQNATRVGAI